VILSEISEETSGQKSRRKLGSGCQIIFKLAFPEPDLSKAEKIPTEEIAPNYTVAETNFEIKISNSRKLELNVVEIGFDRISSRGYVALHPPVDQRKT
jgi:hypothetical protein